MKVQCPYGLHDTEALTFGDRTKILETMARTRSFIIMLKLKSEKNILKMFQCFLKKIKKHRLDKVRVCMQIIMSLILNDNDKLLLDLLAIFQKEQAISPIAYRVCKRLIDHKIETFQKHTTKNELISMGLQAAGSLKRVRTK